MPKYSTCPDCSLKTQLTPKTGRFRNHTVNGNRCPGSGKPAPIKQSKYKAIKVTASIFAGIVATAAGITAVLQFVGISPNPSGSQPTSSAAKTNSSPPIKIASSPRQLVSSNSAGVVGNGDSGRPSFDASGRYVVFTSDATNLAPGATNGQYNIYRKDRESGATYLASSGMNGNPSNGSSQFPVICPTGRFIAFASVATNLVPPQPGIDGSNYQVYVNDSLTHQTYLVSADNAGVAANGDSRNPMFTSDCSNVVFESSPTNLSGASGEYNVYVRNLLSNSITLASAGDESTLLNAASTHAAINQQGTMVAFTSWATNLPAAKEGTPAVYLRYLRTKQTINASSTFMHFCPNAKGFSWPSFSPDGHYLVFTSVNSSEDPDFRGNCVFVWDITKGKSAIAGATGAPVGWSDACVTGVNNGTTFAPEISDTTRSHPYLILFTIARQNGACSLVLRDLQGNDIPVKSQVNQGQILEPSINSSSDYLSLDVAGNPQQVYACKVASCSDSLS
jgi:Tol biopolymer transport system component